MKTCKRTHCLLVVSLAVSLAPTFAVAADESALAFGALQGVALDAAGNPLAMAKVAIRSADGSTERKVVSGRDGVFAAERLKPGQYRVTASKEGIGSSPTTTIVVAQNQTARSFLVLAEKPAAAPAALAAPMTIEQELQAMKDRIAALEAELKARPAAPAMAAPPPAATAAVSPAVPPVTAAVSPAASPAVTAAVNPAAPPASAAAASPALPAVTAAAEVPTQQAGGKAPASTVPPPPTPTPEVPEALSTPEPAPAVDNDTPFAFGDFTWLNGTPRNKDTVLDTKFFTPEIRFDTNYMTDFNQPKDHTIVGATESFRSGEVQIEQASVGGDFHWQNVRGRILFMFGMFATTTPRNDASYGVGQWDLRGAYKYVSEAYGGYHFNVNHGLNIDAGIFVSYIGLFSYYNFDNWTYQPSYVSSNTPWFFNGVRVQWFPTNKLKIEPWFINGWQSYAKYNGHPGLGGQLLWEPKEWFKLVANQYGYGQDNLGLPHTERIHTDDSIEVRYYNKPESPRHFEDGILSDGRCGMPIWRRHSVHRRAQQEQGFVCGVDGSMTGSGSTRICMPLRLAAER